MYDNFYVSTGLVYHECLAEAVWDQGPPIWEATLLSLLR